MYMSAHLISVLGKWKTQVKIMVGIADYSLFPEISLQVVMVVGVKATCRHLCFQAVSSFSSGYLM